MLMACGKNCEKYRLTTAVCVSIKPASKWHLNMASTRLTSGFGAGVSKEKAGSDFARRALPRVTTEDLTKSRRFMGTWSRGNGNAIILAPRAPSEYRNARWWTGGPPVGQWR